MQWEIRDLSVLGAKPFAPIGAREGTSKENEKNDDCITRRTTRRTLACWLQEEDDAVKKCPNQDAKSCHDTRAAWVYTTRGGGGGGGGGGGAAAAAHSLYADGCQARTHVSSFRLLFLGRKNVSQLGQIDHRLPVHDLDHSGKIYS